jgi:hypothetical protein
MYNRNLQTARFTEPSPSFSEQGETHMMPTPRSIQLQPPADAQLVQQTRRHASLVGCSHKARPHLFIGDVHRQLFD